MRRLLFSFLLGLSVGGGSFAAEKNPKNPVVEEAPDGSGRMLLLPLDVRNFLLNEFPLFRIPKDSEYSPEMLQYFNSRLVGVHPAVAWGDFNGDKKKDYAFLIITGDTKWGPLVEVIVLNGRGKTFDSYRLGEVYDFKDHYISSNDNKLYKGRYKKGGWYINWDKKTNTYTVLKS
ncbi:MAG: hypothetical protein KCHDKBKB_02754 [Elusimicrobia bacterium]|nr:hypothetical protein [Elusimicrobiota bacterium]